MIPKSSRFKCCHCGWLKRKPGKCVWCGKVADFDNLMVANANRENSEACGLVEFQSCHHPQFHRTSPARTGNSNQ